MSAGIKSYEAILDGFTFSHDPIAADEVRDWFEAPEGGILRSDDPKPSAEIYNQLAQDIDALARKYLSLDVRGELLIQVGNSAIQLERAIEFFEQYECGGNWAGTFAAAQDLLREMTFLGERTPKPGAKPKKWHRYARPLSKLFISALATVPYTGSVNPKQSESVVAQLCARAATRAFRLATELEPAGFSQSLISRNRSKASPFKLVRKKPNST